MQRFVFTILLCGLPLTSRSAEQKITQEAVLQAMAALEEAETKKDTSALFPLLADDFTITMKLPDGRVRASMTLPEYKAFLTELFTKATNYQHSRGKVTVEVAGDGKTATARFETHQHEERADKGKIDWTNLETDTFVFRDGKVLLRSVETVLQSRKHTPP